MTRNSLVAFSSEIARISIKRRGHTRSRAVWRCWGDTAVVGDLPTQSVCKPGRARAQGVELINFEATLVGKVSTNKKNVVADVPFGAQRFAL